ncbi:hypothetical protein [Leisingera sp. ANG-DT]|uniref:hypothetical protein n=1 Tax=Leisingera sp. ANG-DT TaxID=1577897 RepID=UPI00057F9A26|nr:hypothetical protein [Leisingera sp. ANG-DT]
MSIEILKKLWRVVKGHPITVLLIAVRWVFVIGGVLYYFAYTAYKESFDISTQLTNDFIAVETKQNLLVEHLVMLSDDLVTPGKLFDLGAELDETQDLARSMLVSLGKVRAPTKPIIKARQEYKIALEDLIGVSNKIRRAGVSGMAPELYNSIQIAANEAGEFRSAVEDFQGGALPQVIGSFF